MNNFERFTLEAFLERQLGTDERKSFRLASFAANGWDVGMLAELAAIYARIPSADRRFDINIVSAAADPWLVFKRHRPDPAAAPAAAVPHATAAH